MSLEKPTKKQDLLKNNYKKRADELIIALTDTKERTEKVEEVMAELEVIINIEDNNIQKQAMQVFIEKRLKELEKELPEKQKTLSLIGNISQSQFIHNETVIKRSWIVDGFNINDSEIYTVLLKNFIKFYKHWNKPNLRSIIGHSIIYALSEYFGNHFGTNITESRNREFYLNHTTTDSEIINLSELKGKNLAVCAEKATVAHNYLKFLGIDSHVVFSNNCKIGNTTDSHAYVLFTTINGKFIFDPTNPILIEDNEGKINSFNPALYKISEEDYNHLLNDNHQVIVQHIDQKIENGKYLPQKTQNRIYG